MSIYKGTQLISGATTLVGESKNVGQIVQSTIPLTDAGLHLLDGALIDGTGIYSEFVDYIASIYDASASYFTTEASWQDAVTNYGVCGKFVYDSVNNTVRLPKYSNKIYTKSINSTAPVMGNGMTLGLTDGTNNYGTTYSSAQYGITLNQAEYGGTPATSGATSNKPAPGSSILGITTDPTKSGLIAQLSNITTSVDGYYYIVVATSTKTDIQVDIDEITTDLNGKVDKSSLSEVYPVIETYSNGTSWYRVYSDGWCEQGGLSTSTTSGRTINLLKPYKDTNYTINVLGLASAENGNYSTIVSTTRTTSSFIVFINRQCNWQTCGYIS